MDYPVSQRIKARIRTAHKHLHRFIGKPVLPLVEVHLADHCNLNCRGCSHFSPIAADRFIDLDRFNADLTRLSKLFCSIGTIRLMGGEPLLFPGVTDAIALSRKHFPHSDVRVVTNGILLLTIGEHFWQACNEHEVNIDLSQYPISLDIDRILKLADEHSVYVEPHVTNEFYAFINPNGDSDPREAMNKCRMWFNCPYLLEGKLYVCCIPATVHHYNEKYGASIPVGGAIDIYDDALTGREILTLLDQPVPACSYCVAGEQLPHKWAASRREINEWSAEPGLVQIATGTELLRG